MRKNKLIILLSFIIILLCIYVGIKSPVENFQNSRAIVFNLNGRAGFYSVLFFLCEAYIVAERNNVDFYIIDSEWPYKSEKGWHDYFSTLTVFDKSKESMYNDIIMCSHANLNELKKHYTYNLTLSDYMDCIQQIYKLKDNIVSHANKIRGEMNNDYISIFIRRGDKITSGESKFISTQDILNQIHILPKDTIFVQTDDYTVIEEIKSLVPNKVHSIVPKTKRGSHHEKLLSLSPTERQAWTEEMLMGLYVCSYAKACWTDGSSNVGRFLKLYSHENTQIYKIENESYVFDTSRTTVNPAYAGSFQ